MSLFAKRRKGHRAIVLGIANIVSFGGGYVINGEARAEVGGVVLIADGRAGGVASNVGLTVGCVGGGDEGPCPQTAKRNY